MRLTVISDTHGYHEQVKLPGGDILIHCGDVSSGRKGQTERFVDWFSRQSYDYKIFIAGNMDYKLASNPLKYTAKLPDKTYYLLNNGISINSINFWGSPVVPNFVGVFNVERGNKIRAYWEKIPKEIDILITHTPPYGVLDKTSSGLEVGCKELLHAVIKKPPVYHVFGHVHESYGKNDNGRTHFINASFLKGRKPGNNPFNIEFTSTLQ